MTHPDRPISGIHIDYQAFPAEDQALFHTLYAPIALVDATTLRDCRPKQVDYATAILSGPGYVSLPHLEAAVFENTKPENLAPSLRKAAAENSRVNLSDIRPTLLEQGVLIATTVRSKETALIPLPISYVHQKPQQPLTQPGWIAVAAQAQQREVLGELRTLFTYQVQQDPRRPHIAALDGPLTPQTTRFLELIVTHPDGLPRNLYPYQQTPTNGQKSHVHSVMASQINKACGEQAIPIRVKSTVQQTCLRFP